MYWDDFIRDMKMAAMCERNVITNFLPLDFNILNWLTTCTKDMRCVKKSTGGNIGSVATWLYMFLAKLVVLLR